MASAAHTRIPAEGLFGAGSVSWRVHADPAMGLAGLRALLLQALHPLAMAGVAEHSAFREDPWGRLYRTASFIGAVTYGTGPEVEAAVAKVRQVHLHVRGTDPVTGLDYRADDPHLLTWVHCSEVDSFLGVTRRSGLRLTDAEADTYLREQARVAHLVGVPDDHPVPSGTAELADYFTAMRGELKLTPAAREAARFALLPPLPTWVQFATPARPVWVGLAGLAFAMLPGWARRMYGLPGWRLVSPVTDVQARALRAGLSLLPRTVKEGPHLRAARRRWSTGAGEPAPAARAGAEGPACAEGPAGAEGPESAEGPEGAEGPENPSGT
ncbi:oxygenase MpaB family protein [Streptomyces sp. 549]|uniref:oxygenase MpaB family protein n=1 Tax=Streptomyces sp. 549 TaxID=3049076 RepID=UPI0024C38EAE|nr:oxygenase MpaB family protein [Streptomyces sp. 549]MDK1472848.1 oxygenase MpaB family protein [Streptomyces sp. 549]